MNTRYASDRTRPVHLRPRNLALVGLGGVLGTAGREGLGLVIPTLGVLPLSTWCVNVAGAFLLGMFLEALSRRGPDEGRRRSIRLLVGTGLLGGFTTYSALATETVLLLNSGSIGWAIGYSIGTVVVGGVASWLGIVVAARIHDRHQRNDSQTAEVN